MHIPDGFLDAKVALTTTAVSVCGVSYALRTLKRRLDPEKIPVIGLTAAFVFAAQMLNFPVAGGASGHLMGAVLTSVLLGPSAAVLVMTSVLILQCFMFADGGVTALGANIFNMALVAPLTGYAIFSLACRLTGNDLRGRIWSAAFAAWCSTMASSAACAAELAMSGTVPISLVLPAMAGVHLFIGLGEALLTAMIIAALARADSDFFIAAPSRKEAAAYTLLVMTGLAVVFSPFASALPDGLEKVAGMLGFEGCAFTFMSALSYTVAAAFAGALVTFVLAYFAARALCDKNGTLSSHASSES